MFHFLWLVGLRMITFVEPNGMWSSFEWSPDKVVRMEAHHGTNVLSYIIGKELNYVNDNSLNKLNPGSVYALSLIILYQVLW